MSNALGEDAVVAGSLGEVVADAAVEVLISFQPVLMSLAEVEALHRGSVIEIGKRLSEARLSVHACGRRLGSGTFIVGVANQAGVLLNTVD